MSVFHVKDDFRQGAPIAQVPAAWFNSVGRFLNNLVGDKGLKVDRDAASPKVTYDEDTLRAIVSKPSAPESSKDISGKFTDTYVVDDIPPVTADAGETSVWVAGGEKGYVEDAIVASDAANASGSFHRLWFVKKRYSADGRLLSVEPTGSADFVAV